MRVLVACEFSGVVREAFRARGHDAWSCDLLPSEGSNRWHIRGNIFDVFNDCICQRCPDGGGGIVMGSTLWTNPLCALHGNQTWDLMIAHPPCTHLAVSGARWFKDKQAEQAEALAFVRGLMAAPVERIAIENPISIISSRIRKPDQIIQPWMFGHGETKATCLWLKNLPNLQPTNIVEGREQRVFKMSPGPDRWKERSRTYAGIAEAMAAQWGSL